jgi:RNA polymerase sigma-70 factor (ECF subfamily)
VLTTRLTLLERLRDPADEAAWERFVELYVPLMLSWAERLGLQSADASDLTQDVVVNLLRKFADFQYNPAGSFRAWLRTVFLNKHRERCRRKFPLTTGDTDVWNGLREEPSEEENAEDRRLLVQRGLELIRPEFSPSVWSAFWEYAVQGRPPAQVAAELGLSIGTIYVSKSRVLARLKLEIEGLPS